MNLARLFPIACIHWFYSYSYPHPVYPAGCATVRLTRGVGHYPVKGTRDVLHCPNAGSDKRYERKLKTYTVWTRSIRHHHLSQLRVFPTFSFSHTPCSSPRLRRYNSESSDCSSIVDAASGMSDARITTAWRYRDWPQGWCPPHSTTTERRTWTPWLCQ